MILPSVGTLLYVWVCPSHDWPPQRSLSPLASAARTSHDESTGEPVCESSDVTVMVPMAVGVAVTITFVEPQTLGSTVEQAVTGTDPAVEGAVKLPLASIDPAVEVHVTVVPLRFVTLAVQADVPFTRMLFGLHETVTEGVEGGVTGGVAVTVTFVDALAFPSGPVQEIV